MLLSQIKRCWNCYLHGYACIDSSIHILLQKIFIVKACYVQNTALRQKVSLTAVHSSVEETQQTLKIISHSEKCWQFNKVKDEELLWLGLGAEISYVPFRTSGLWRSLEEEGSFSAQQGDEKKDAHHVQTWSKSNRDGGKSTYKALKR